MEAINEEEKRLWVRELLSFVLITIVILCVQLYKNIGYEQYFWDCSLYHNYGCELFSSGRYDLHTLTSGFRGYVFPSLLGWSAYIDGKLGLNCVMLKIFTSIIYGFFFSYIVPRLSRVLYGNTRDKIICNIINLAIIGVLFWGLFIYPLTDMLGVVLCSTSVLLLLETTDDKVKISIRCVKLFIAGVLSYASYNVRSIYLFSTIAILLGIVVFNYRNVKLIVLNELVFMLGIIVCSIPQIIINKNLLDTVSIMLPTQNLMLSQLNWGMQYQKYETYVGSAYESPALIFKDYVGDGLLENMAPINSFKDYICRVFRYPLDYIGIYARHIINMFLPIYPEQYIYDLQKNRSIYVVLNYSLLFVFGADKIQKIKNKEIKLSKEKSVGFLALLLPSVAIMPGALEQRFSLMLYIIIISNLVYGIDYKNFVSNLKRKWLRYVIMFILIFIVLLAIWGNTLSCLQFANIIIGY